jgi:hypothetical protein
MKLKHSRPLQLERKADQGRIWLEPWLQNVAKTDGFGSVQIFKTWLKFDDIWLKFSQIYQNLVKP